MNKQTERNAARLILLCMCCSIIATIASAFTSEAKTTIEPETAIVELETPIAGITVKKPIYFSNITVEVHSVLSDNITATEKPGFTENENLLVQSENKTETSMEEITETIEEVIEPEEIVEPKNLAKDGTPYRYYKIIDEGYEATLDYELQEYTYDLCVDYGITEYFTLILSQLYKESGYRYDVISKTNDWGIAQINKCNHKWLSKELGITDFLDPRQSILCNIYLMSKNLKKYSVESSLICYNAGNPNSANPHAKRYAKNIIKYWNNCVVEIQKEQ